MPTRHTFRLLHQRHVQGVAHLECAVATSPALPRWLRAALAAAWPQIKPFTQAPWQLSLRVVSAAEATQANALFRNKDYTPDVLTFPLWEEGYAGDILLCWPKLVADAKAQGKPLQAHVQHLVIHSLLHLAGEDHLTPSQAARMERQEIVILKLLNWPNPYVID